jgi:hypothetical protein
MEMIRDIEFKFNGDFVEMWWEDDMPPFDGKLMGCIRRGDDNYYRFHPARKTVMNCKCLRVLAKKVSDLNMSE